MKSNYNFSGVINIYKEKGFTSHDVVNIVRNTLSKVKTGHTGTLDPEAEGVLPVCVGKATKLADYIAADIKEYIAEDNEEMAVKTIQEIYARIENIQQFPYMGADLAKRVSFRTDYKYVICGNYVVLYKIGEEYVEIYRVMNRHQDITKIF